MQSARPGMAYGAPAVYDALIAPRYAPVADELVAVARLRPGDHVLELGAGTGLVTRRAAERVSPGGLVVATDKSVPMLERARQSVLGASAMFATVDYNEPLPFLDATFDVVLSGLTYAQDRDESVRELLRVLVPGGHIVLSMWGPDYLELQLMSAAKVRLDLDPIPAPDPAAAQRRLAQCGFDEIERRDFDLAPRYTSVDEYLAYRRGFGIPLGSSSEEHERYLTALGDEAAKVAAPDGSFTQGWAFSLLSARKP